MILLPEIYNMICKKSSLDFESSRDYETLLFLIKDQTGRSLGLNTIKRLFCVLSEKVNPSPNTVNVVALYLGFDSWSLLLESLHEDLPDEDAIFPETLASGTHVILRYKPDRTLELEILPNKRCRVINVNKGSLRKDDILHIDRFQLDHPLDSDSLVRDGKPLGPYLSALDGGISQIEIIPHRPHPALL